MTMAIDPNPHSPSSNTQIHKRNKKNLDNELAEISLINDFNPLVIAMPRNGKLYSYKYPNVKAVESVPKKI